MSAPVLESLRRKAVEGLQAIPKVGLGIGGFLIGARQDDGLVVEDSIEIPCSHAGGPSFSLTLEERESAVKLAQEARTGAVVGWYFSKTRAPLHPDPALYSELCPEPWQLALLISPSSLEITRARLFFRNSDGALTAGEERELVEEPSVDPGETTGFQPVRTFSLVPRTSARKKEFAAAASPAPELNEQQAVGEWGFSPAPRIRLKGQVSKPAVQTDADVVGEPESSFDAIRTVRFVGSKAGAASPLHPELEELANVELPATEPDSVPEPLPMPDGPGEFSPIRRIDFSSREKQPPPKPKVSGDDASAPAAPPSEGSGGFEPVRKSMFKEEPKTGPAPLSTTFAETPPLPFTKSIQFSEAEPARSTAAETPTEPAAPVGPIRTAAFMSAEEKNCRRRHLIEELEKEDAAAATDEVDPSTLARRKVMLMAAIVIALSAAVFLTRGLWMAKPLKLDLTETNGHITALWNAETLQAGAAGTLTLTDGHETKVLQLPAAKLAEGVTGFDRKSDQVSATLRVAGKSASASWKR